MPPSAATEPEIDSVSQGVHYFLLDKHRTLYFTVWTVSVFAALALSIPFVLSDPYFLSLTQNDGTLFLVLFTLFIPPAAMYLVAQSRMRREMMQQIALSLGFTYAASASADSVSGELFSIGHSHKIFDVLSGAYRGFPVRVFTFQYTVGSGKSSHTYDKTVFELTYSAALPHILLVPVLSYLMTPSGLEAVELEGDFGKRFALYISRGAQMEAREVFQPDFMQEMIDTYAECQFETLGTVLSIVTGSEITARAQFMSMRSLADSLIDNLLPGLQATAQNTVPEAPVAENV